MRKLAIGGFAFGFGVFLAVYFLDELWVLYAAAGAVCVGILGFAAKDKKLLVRIICFAMAFGLIWSWVYDALCYRPAQALDGTKSTVTAKLTDYPDVWKYGYKLNVKLQLEGSVDIRTNVYTYGELDDLLPGDIIQMTANFRLTNVIDGEETLSTISRGVMLNAFSNDDIQVVGHKDSIIYAPKIVAKAVRDKIGEIFPEDAAAFLKAMLIGDRSEISDDLALTNAMSDAGIYHIIAVSGLHVSFLASMIYMIFGRKRWTAVIIIPLLLFYMTITGFTPSVTRAGIMQIFLVTALVFKTDSDSITSLSFALVILLIVNPYAIASVGLQMSFLATLGIILITPKICGSLIRLAKISKKHDRPFAIKVKDKVLSFIIISFATTIGALVLTMPLSALYFKSVSLAAPFSNLLTLWIASFIFSFGLVVCVIGFICMPAAVVLAYPVTLAVRYVLWIAALIGQSGFAAVYTYNRYIVLWLVFIYFVGIVFVLLKGKFRQMLLPCSVSVIFLCAVLVITSVENDAAPISVTALDVGQGQCIMVTAGAYTIAVDCGSSYADAGNILGDYILSIGRSKLDALVITHYDSDHCNGVDELMERIDIGLLLLPDPSLCESEIAGEFVDLAVKKNIDILYVNEDIQANFGNSIMRVYAPLTHGDENDMGLVSLISYDDFDVLITGDISRTTEQILVKEKDLPDIEVLVAGHHGSRTSTGYVLLEAVRPETVIISVGSNSYGHPSQEVLERIEHVGAVAYRTDLMGNVTVTFTEE